jgi:hypothetical protein
MLVGVSGMPQGQAVQCRDGPYSARRSCPATRADSGSLSLPPDHLPERNEVLVTWLRLRQSMAPALAMHE